MGARRVSFPTGSKTEPEKTTSHLRERPEAGGKFFTTGVRLKSYSFGFLCSGTGSAGMQDTCLIDVLLIAALPLEFTDKADGFVG